MNTSLDIIHFHMAFINPNSKYHWICSECIKTHRKNCSQPSDLSKPSAWTVFLILLSLPTNTLAPSHQQHTCQYSLSVPQIRGRIDLMDRHVPLFEELKSN